MGVELGKPLYGATGQRFLQNKIPNYTNSSLGTTLTDAILNGLEGPKIARIKSGVQRVLDGADDLTEEEKCAEGAVRMHDLSLRSSNPPSVNDGLIGDTFRVLRETGTFSYPDSYYMLLAEVEKENAVEEIDDIKLNNLYAAYNYFMKHQGEISQEFMQTVNGMSIEEKVAYYVVSIGERILEQALAKTPRDIDE